MRSVALFVALLLVLSGVGPAVAASAAGADAPGSDGATALHRPADGIAPSQLDASLDRTPETVMNVELRADKDAEWRVSVTYELETENETRAFEQIGRAYESGESAFGVEAGLFRRIAARASETTGREMQIQNVTYDYSVAEGEGTLSVSFVWTNFLEAGVGNNLRLGDVFLVPNDEAESTPTWLSLMGEHQRMVIEPPEGYATNTTSIRVKQQNNAIILVGPSQFEDDDHLVVTYRPTGLGEENEWWLFVGGGALVFVALAVGAAVVLKGRRDGELGPPTIDAGGGSGGPAAETNGGASAQEPDDPADAVEEVEMDLSLLSDEERVEHLLERHGGRMRQAKIVKETGWSDAKVSQLLSAMADDGRVTKLRLGRENLISLPDEADDGDETN